MIKAERASIVKKILDEYYPETPVPLDHKDNFTLLIAVLLSAQCTDERVNKVTPKLFKLANSAVKMQKIDVKKIYEIIRPCGLAPKKSQAIAELSKIIVEKYKGIVPKKIEQLELDFIYNFNKNKFTFDNVIIDKKSSDKLNNFLNEFNSSEKKFLNKISFKNFINNFFENYAG